MTKADELRILDRAIAALTAESYLGPWLAGVRAEVAQQVRADFVPTLWPSQAEAEARETIQAANDRAVDLLTQAEAQAARIVGAAKAEAGRTHVQAVEALRGALASLGVRS